VPQLSSKRPGLVADGITWNNAETLREHLQLRLAYPEVRLLWSGDWSTFSGPDFWVTIAGVTFPDADGALGWCRGHNLDRDHCYAKLVSTSHPIYGSLSTPCTDTPTPTPPNTPKLSVPPPKIHSGSPPKIHEIRDMLQLRPEPVVPGIMKIPRKKLSQVG
jgi:hypothetical protein